MTLTKKKKKVKVTPNSPSQDYSHPDDHNLRTYDMTPGFKPFTILICMNHLLSTPVGVQFHHAVNIFIILPAW